MTLCVGPFDIGEVRERGNVGAQGLPPRFLVLRLYRSEMCEQLLPLDLIPTYFRSSR